ncbi:contact-dependent growth inhibition system immunity protein [Rodentibacter trehalosifermentans]|nr:contact-dependent growth inhibition system immunity protein [Rodentibacter trehalosifermentans]
MMYQNLKYLFSSYFHQDWMLTEGETLEDVLNSFKRNESVEILQKVVCELSILLDQKYVGEDFVYSLGCFMIPEKEPDGNILLWLRKIQKYLELT